MFTLRRTPAALLARSLGRLKLATARFPRLTEPAGRDLWRLTFERSPVGTCLVDLDGRLREPNLAFVRITGYTREELRDRTFMDITHLDDLAADLELYEQTLQGHRDDYRITKRFVRSDGHVMWGELMVTLVRTDDGAPAHFISQVMDVTEQREDRERLRHAMGVIDDERSLLTTILDTVDVGLLLVDQRGGRQRENRRQREILAMADPQSAAGGTGAVVGFYAADGTTLLDAATYPSARAVRGEEFSDERVWAGPDPASRRALSVSARTVRDANGEPAGAALAFSDVTDLEHALRARMVFESSVSHELRTPLTAVLGHLEMLIDGGDVPDNVLSQLRTAERNANRLRLLVSDLLDPAARGEGTLELFRAPANITTLVQETVSSMTAAAHASNIGLLLGAAPLARAFVDAHRVRQVLDNLVSNAIKYTNNGGHITVQVETDYDVVAITVSDTGIGMNTEDLRRAWEPFYRADDARRRVTPGVGLGLGIVQSIVGAHGGQVEATSQPGEGTTFRVTLPRGQATLQDLELQATD